MTRITYARRLVAGAVAVGVVLAAAACSSGGGTGGSTDGSTGGGTAAGNRTAGIVDVDETIAITAQQVAAARSALEADGWQVLSQDPKGDAGQANTICSQYVTRKVQAIIIMPWSLDQMSQCMSQAKTANIPVFWVGSPLEEGMAGAIDITSPKPINDLFIQYLKDQQVTDVLALDYTPGTPCLVRKEYRDQQLQDVDVNVTRHEFPSPGQVVDSQNATAAWLAAHPAGSGKFAIWACYTDPSVGAVAALKQANRTDVPIYTWDFNKTILDPLKSGQIAATLSLDGQKTGAAVAGLVDDYLKTGKAVAIPAEVTILTKDNIDQFLQDNPSALDS